VSEAKEEYLRRCEDDLSFFCKNEVWIRPKHKVKGGLMQLDLNPGQLTLHNTISSLEEQERAIWLLVLKHRQWGSSTFFQAMTMHRCRFVPYTEALVIADRERTTRKLMGMNRRMWERFSPAVKDDWSRTVERTDSQYEWNNGSVLQIDTAGQSQAARGTTADLIHCSEVAFWNNGDRIIPAMTSSLADVSGSICVMESTSAGPHGIFWELWEQAEDPWSQWTRVFVPWTSHPEYDDTERLDPDLKDLGDRAAAGDKSALDDLKHLTQQEHDWLINGELKLGQVYWRRRTLATRLMGKEEEFCREYPSTAEEAFRSASYNYLTDNGQKAQKAAAVENTTCYDVIIDDVSLGNHEHEWKKDPLLLALDSDPEERVVPEESADGWIQVIDPPDEDKRYIIGFDPSEGTGGDNCAFVVRCDGKIVAAGCRNDIGTDIQAVYMDAIGRWYNDATLNVERAGGGLGAINTLIRLIYPNLYGQESFDEYGQKQGRKVGFTPTQDTIATLLSMMRHELNNGTMLARHPRLLKEINWVKRIAKRSRDESVRHTWRCPGKGRELKDGSRISDDMFRACSLTVLPARDSEWIRQMDSSEATNADPEKTSITSIGYTLHNPLYSEDEKTLVSEGGYDLIEIVPEDLEETPDMPLP